MANNSPPPYQPAPLQNSTTAIISLIAGIAGLTVFPVVGSIVAVILGHMAKGEIARSGGNLGGGGAATVGLVLGYVGIGLTALGLCGLGFFFLCPFLALFFNTSSSSSSWLPLLQLVV